LYRLKYLASTAEEKAIQTECCFGSMAMEPSVGGLSWTSAVLTKGSVLGSAAGHSLRPALRPARGSDYIAAFRSQNGNFGGAVTEAGGDFRRAKEVQGIDHTGHKLGAATAACELAVREKEASGRCLVEVDRRWKCIDNHIHDVALAFGAGRSSHSQAGHSSWDVGEALSEHILPCEAQSSMGHLPLALLSRREYFVARAPLTRDTCPLPGECGVNLDRL